MKKGTGMEQIVGAKPRHDPFAEPLQFRLKVQTFTSSPPVLTLRQVDFEPENQRIINAYHRALPYTQFGQEIYMHKGGGVRREPGSPVDPENVERSARRARKRLQDTIRELVPEGMLTLTTRRLLTDRDIFWRCVQRLIRAVREVNPEFAAIVVPEKHFSGEHLHAHIAYRGLALGFGPLRRLWHAALLAEDGVRVTRALRGAESPGNIDVQRTHARGGIAGRARRIGRYMGKYLSKDLVSEFGRKAYSPTKGIKVAAAQRYYLQSLTVEEAKREALGIVGLGPSVHEAVQFWHPPGSSLWHVALDDMALSFGLAAPS